jgi:hypothetical protein
MFSLFLTLSLFLFLSLFFILYASVRLSRSVCLFFYQCLHFLFNSIFPYICLSLLLSPLLSSRLSLSLCLFLSLSGSVLLSLSLFSFNYKFHSLSLLIFFLTLSLSPSLRPSLFPPPPLQFLSLSLHAIKGPKESPAVYLHWTAPRLNGTLFTISSDIEKNKIMPERSSTISLLLPYRSSVVAPFRSPVKVCQKNVTL